MSTYSLVDEEAILVLPLQRASRKLSFHPFVDKFALQFPQYGLAKNCGRIIIIFTTQIRKVSGAAWTKQVTWTH